jgi:Ca-activated chloride channel family protein
MNSKTMGKVSLVFLGLLLAVTFAFTHDTAVEAQISAAKATPTPTPSVAPTIKEEDDRIVVDTQLVNLNVRVVDRNGRPVNDLKQSDFKVFEEGAPQSIEFFSKSEVPTNYTLVVDNSGSLRQQLDKVIEAGKILVDSNRKDDETSIIRFVGNDKITIEEDFTSKKQDLDEALDNMFIEGGQTAVRDAVYLAAQRITDYEKSNKIEDRVRRALVLVTDGEDRNSFYTEAQLFELLKETDVQIYVIGFVDDLDNDAGFIRKSPKSKSKAFLEKLAADTGGKAYFPSGVGELPEIARNVSTELRTQYSIGYPPQNDLPPGTFRNIKVMVNDGPGGAKRIAITKAGRTVGGPTSAGPTIKKGN